MEERREFGVRGNKQRAMKAAGNTRYIHEIHLYLICSRRRDNSISNV